jgi:ligand-binding sensor domain-containing protein
LLGLLLAAFVTPATARDLSFDHFIHTKLEAKEGLPVQANSIVQTPDGYLWFGTPDGLYRYNGQTFEHMPVERRNRFIDAAIIEAIVTKRGELWLGMGQNSGVAVLRDGIVRQTNMPHPPPQITHVLERTDGMIWAASSGKTKRLFRYSGGGWQQMDEVMSLPIGAVADLECDRQGTIWVSLASPGGSRLAYLRAGSMRFETARDRIGLGRLAVDPKGGLWISDNFGTRLLRDPSGHPPVRPIAYPPTPNIGCRAFRRHVSHSRRSECRQFRQAASNLRPGRPDWDGRNPGCLPGQGRQCLDIEHGGPASLPPCQRSSGDGR